MATENVGNVKKQQMTKMFTTVYLISFISDGQKVSKKYRIYLKWSDKNS